MDKRYQVFISSTFTDLKEERKIIIQNLLNAHYIPAGMEMFSASNDEQFKYIKKIIDTCDYYILIVGARYGSINPSTGLSYTEQEYDYALSKNIPILVFLHDDPYNLPYDKRDDKKEQLELFREKVSNGRMVKKWNTTIDLASNVIISLTELVSDNPQLGWSRGNIEDTADLLAQINVLRIEKEKLEEELKRLENLIDQNNVKFESLARGEDTYIVIAKELFQGNYYDASIKLSWDDIFSTIGPYLFSYVNYIEFGIYLKNGINATHDTEYNFINDNCIQTIKIQLTSLGLIDIKTLKNVQGDISEFIGLTEKGKEYLLQIKSIKR